MIKNPDGTPYPGESIAQMLKDRFEQEEHPYLSDILGDDWGMSLEPGESFESGAYRVARMLYEYDAVHLYPDEDPSEKMPPS